MPKGKVTSGDVAKLARVSQSAVSRAFNEGASVSDGMRARVKKAAGKLVPQCFVKRTVFKKLLHGFTHFGAELVVGEFGS